VGKTATCFEELWFYQEARELTNAVYVVTRTADFRRDRSLVDQIRRACVSIVSNIAEGYERGSSTEMIQFFYIAKGSCGEVRAQLQIAADQSYITDEQFRELSQRARRISGMIANFVKSVEGSGYKGAKANAPRRRAVAAAEHRQQQLRASQQRNMRKPGQLPPSEQDVE